MTIINGYVPPYKPLTNISPFTYRDGETYLAILERLRAYVNETLVEFINTEYTALGDNFELEVNKLITDVNTFLDAQTAENASSIAELTAYVDNAVQTIINSTIDVTDPALENIINTPTSASRIKLDSIYADISVENNVNNIETELNNRLSNSQLNNRYATVFSSTGGDDLVALNAYLSDGIDSVKRIVGEFTISNEIVVPAGVIADFTDSVITQTSLKTASIRANVGSTIIGANIVGVGASDWVNTSAVYAACGVLVTGDNVTIRNLKVTNIAGAGVYLAVAYNNITIIDCIFEGVGSPTIPAGVGGQYSGGVVINNSGANNLTVKGGSISGFAQGIVTGNIFGSFIGGGIKISTAGQHGIYFASAVNCVISDVIINGTGLEGIKIQIQDLEGIDSDNVIISNVVMTNLGSHGVHFANVQTTPSNRNKKILIHDVSVSHKTNGAGSGILIEHGDDVIIHDCISLNSNFGISLFTCNRVNAHHNKITKSTLNGIQINIVTDSDFDNNRIIGAGVANNASSGEDGIFVAGAASANLRFINNKITEVDGNTRFGFYIAAGDLTTMQFINNLCYGVTDYGFRSAVTTSTKVWLNNDLIGTLGRFFNVPTNAGAIADTSGATLTALETEVNKLKARLRSINSVNP